MTTTKALLQKKAIESVGYCCFFVWGMGQLVPLGWWYLHGVSPGDVVFLAYVLVMALHSSQFRADFIKMGRENWKYILIVSSMMAVMLFSLWFHRDALAISPFYVLSILRSGYFLFVTGVIVLWVKDNDYSKYVIAYLAGVLIVAIWNFLLSFDPAYTAKMSICGYQILHNSNVMGNMLGVGVLFSCLLILRQKFSIALLFIGIFSYMALYSFSKGTWLMVLFGICAAVMAYFVATRQELLAQKRALAWGGGVLWCAVVFGYAIVHYDTLGCLINGKKDLTAASGSFETRLGYLYNSLGIAKNAFFGVGVGGVAVTTVVDNKSFPATAAKIHSDGTEHSVGYSSVGNPHSAFLHILVSGGIPALILFVLAVLYPFAKLKRAFLKAGFCWNAVFFLMLCAFVVSGSVQLQLFAQHFFWIFSGIVIGMAMHPNQQKYGQILAR